MRGRVTCAAVIALLVTAVLVAQTGTGNIQGTIRDSSGAVVPRAKVSIVHTSTERKYTTTTNEVGFYVFPSVQRGPYQIQVEAPGMEIWKGDLVLMVGQTVEVSPALNVGATATAVTVAGDVTPLVTTTSGTLGNVLERARLDQLPLDGRFLQNLVLSTTPGMDGDATRPRLYGLRFGVEFLQDGAVMVDRYTEAISQRPPGMDTVEEFRTETNNSSAKMNRPGAVIVTTKAGTNQVHGSAFETARNSGIGVARRREDYYTKAPHLVRNEFGASLGGPVFIPKIYNGKNRTFFFFGHEGYRQMSASTTSVSMPTLAMRQGDFSGLVDGAGRKYTIYNPWTTDSKTWQRQPFPNNQIPASLQSPLSKYLYSVTPEPNLTGVNPLVGSNWSGLSNTPARQYTQTARFDHRFTDRDQFFLRLSHGRQSAINRFGLGSSTSPITTDGKANCYSLESEPFTAVASYTHTFSPTFFSETIVSTTHDGYKVNIAAWDENLAGALGLPNPFNANGLPNIDSTGFGMNYWSGVNRLVTNTHLYNVDQNFTKVKGRHEFQFGGRFRAERLRLLPDQQQPMGALAFGSLATGLYDPSSGSSYGAVSYTGHNAANLYLGLTASYSVRANRTWYHMSGGEKSGYFQDNFKVNSRLTLNLGVRYEFFDPARERDSLISGFDPATKSVVLGAPLETFYKRNAVQPGLINVYQKLGMKFMSRSDAGLPESLVYTNPWDFSPRLGLAYRLSEGHRPMVLRGGYSIFGFPESLRSALVNMRSGAPFFATYTISPNSASSSPDGLPNYLLRSVPYAPMVAGVNSTNAFDLNNPVVSRGTPSIRYYNPDQPTARAHEWNVTVERELRDNTSLKLGWVGTHGANLMQWYSYNDASNNYIWYATKGVALPTGEYSSVARRPFENQVIGSIQEYRKSGWSNASAFQIEIQRRYSKGYGFQAFYVMTNAFRAGGNANDDDLVYNTDVFLPGAVPTDYNQLNRFLNYHRDAEIPKHRFNYNWIVDLPFGRGKTFASHSNGFLDRLIGGWQIAGSGSIVSRWWTLPTSNYGSFGKVEIYGTKYPIQDCRSGTCYEGYLYWNGYIPANRINSYASNGTPNGVMGVPADYKASNQPIITTPANGGSSSEPLYAYYDTNTVWVPMKNGSLQRIAYDSNLNPWRNQYMLGPLAWSLNASAFKTVRIAEQVALRFNADFFNVLNRPGYGNPGSDGIISLRNSANDPRLLQLSLRLIW